MLKEYKRYILAAIPMILIIGLKVLEGVKILGDLDTVCAISSADPLRCGSGRVVEFFANPPAWLMALLVLTTLALFYRAERAREAVDIEKLKNIHDEFWNLSGRFYETEDELRKATALLDEWGKWKIHYEARFMHANSELEKLGEATILAHRINTMEADIANLKLDFESRYQDLEIILPDAIRDYFIREGQTLQSLLGTGSETPP